MKATSIGYSGKYRAHIFVSGRGISAGHCCWSGPNRVVVGQIEAVEVKASHCSG